MKNLSINEARHLCLALEQPKVYVIYDLETTGLDPVCDRIINFAARKIIYDGAGTFLYIEEMDKLINPGYPVSEIITKLTGITNEMLAEKPYETDIFPEIQKFMNGCIPIGYNNRRFDNLFMNELYKRCADKEFDCEYDIDVYALSKSIIPDDRTTNHKLSTYTTELGLVDKDYEFHNAMADVIATQMLLEYDIPLAKKHLEEVYAGLIKSSVKRLKYSVKSDCVYVATNNGDFIVDINGKWQCSTSDRIERYNVDDMIEQCSNLTGTTENEDFFYYVKEKGLVFP